MADVEVNSFVGGIVTEASPLNFPANASVDERNFILQNDGTRRRRSGIDYEEGGSINNSGLPIASEVGVFRWEDVANIVGQHFIVVQVGLTLRFHDNSTPILSNNYIGSVTFQTGNSRFSFASIDGFLIVAKGTEELTAVKFFENSFEVIDYRLRVRDLFGVEDRDTWGLIDRGNGVSTRPLLLSQQHKYNLYNQGWPSKRVWVFVDKDKEKTKQLPINFCNLHLGVNPSNADTYTRFVTTSPLEPPTVRGFNPEMMEDGLVPNAYSPVGKFVIDVFQRNSSREKAVLDTGTASVSLPEDVTMGGCRVITEYAGRIFYSGFFGELKGGDSRSPILASYVLFSKAVKYIDDLAVCHQDADPTDIDEFSLIATDGGFVRISEAKNITAMKVLADSLVVFADNGVWQLLGSKDFGFTAENFQIVKITDKGLVGKDTVIDLGDSITYWSHDGIYQIATSPESGLFVAQDISRKTIKTLYDSITSKDSVIGEFDSFDKTIRWVYEQDKELVYRLDLGAYSVNQFSQLPTGSPSVQSLFEGSPYGGVFETKGVVVGSDSVVAAGTPIEVTEESYYQEVKRMLYFTQVPHPFNFVYTFSKLQDTQFLDWKSQDGIGKDAAAYLITGAITGGDTKREKQTNYITNHFFRTEAEIIDVDGDLIPSRMSSCFLTSMWGFTNSPASNKWSRPFQVYRYRRHYMPTGIGDPFDTGDELITTKNKLRGRGKALSIMLESEPLKDVRIVGWSLDIKANPTT